MRTTRAGNNPSGGKPSPACRHIQRQMPLLLDGELSTQEAQRMARHLSVCPLCQRERDQWQQSERALAGARQHIPAPGDLRTGFYARLAAAPVSRRCLPRIDWRVAVPALAACGLAFGWLTAHRPVVALESEWAPARSDAPRQEIAQVNRPPHKNVTINKAPASAFSSFDAPGSNPTQLSSFNDFAAVTRNNVNRKTKQGQPRRIGQQVASAGLRHRLTESRRRPENRSLLELQHLATAIPSELYFEIGKMARIPVEQLAEEKYVRARNRQQDSSYFADLESDANWKLSLQRSKAAAQKDNATLAKTTNSDSATKMKADAFGYIAPAAKSEQNRELKKESLMDAATLDAPAANSLYRELALGVNEPTRRYSYGAERGLGWGAAMGENEGIYLEVEDTKRGFTSSTRLASRTQEQNGQRVLIIQADDAEPLTSEETPSAPVLEPK